MESPGGPWQPMAWKRWPGCRDTDPLGPMKSNEADALLSALVLLAVAAEAVLRGLLIPAAALLLAVAGWGCPARRPAPQSAPRPAAPLPPAPPAVAPAPHPLALLATEASLAAATVADLRRRARAAGLPRPLAHRGRRDALLQALAGAEVALI
jgi:hypothetical protein